MVWYNVVGEMWCCNVVGAVRCGLTKRCGVVMWLEWCDEVALCGLV